MVNKYTEIWDIIFTRDKGVRVMGNYILAKVPLISKGGGGG